MKKIFSLLVAVYLLPMNVLAQVIDVHSHIIPEEYSDFLRAHNAQLQETFPLPKWDIKAHLDFMDDMEIDYSVLSLPAPQPYFGNNNESADMVRKLNVLSAKVRDENPDKFKFLATLLNNYLKGKITNEEEFRLCLSPLSDTFGGYRSNERQ